MFGEWGPGWVFEPLCPTLAPASSVPLALQPPARPCAADTGRISPGWARRPECSRGSSQESRRAAWAQPRQRECVVCSPGGPGKEGVEPVRGAWHCSELSSQSPRE